MKRQKRQWIVGIVMGSPDGPSFGSVTVEAEGYMIGVNNDLCFRNDIKDRCDTVAVFKAQVWLWLGWLGSVVKGARLAHASERRRRSLNFVIWNNWQGCRTRATRPGKI